MAPGRKPEPESTRFWRHVDKQDECWIWTGTVQNAGYGLFRVGSKRDGTRRKVLAHRWAYQDAHGRMPLGVADHCCHNEDLTCRRGDACMHRRCVNPSHLRDVSQAENVRAAMRR